MAIGSQRPPGALLYTGKYDAFLPTELDDKIVWVEVPQGPLEAPHGKIRLYKATSKFVCVPSQSVQIRFDTDIECSYPGTDAHIEWESTFEAYDYGDWP